MNSFEALGQKKKIGDVIFEGNFAQIINTVYIYIYVAGTFRDHVNNILVYTCNEHLYELE